MADPTNGPRTGGMVENQAWANKQVEEHSAQRQQPPQEVARPQETPAPSRAELEAAAIQRNQEENERVAERNAQGRAERQQALNEAKRDLAPKETPNQDQQRQQQQQREI